MSSLLECVLNQNSGDNHIRKEAEWQFNQASRRDPSQVCYQLIELCGDETMSVEIRQSCLLHLKRMVPQFWSLGFASFVGPPLNQQLKQQVREKLLSVATRTSESKLRAAAAYVIAQIAAVDYPDEWPSLLTDLYNRAVEFSDDISVMGSLTVLNDVFDDLIGEDQFWDGGVGNQLITYVTHTLSSEVSPNVKVSGLKLYLSVFNTLSSAEALESEERRSSVLSHIVFLSELLLKLLQNSASSSDPSLLGLKAYVYRVFSQVLSNFSKHVSNSVKSDLLLAMAQDLFQSTTTDPNATELNLSGSNINTDLKGILHLADLLDTLSLLQHHMPVCEVLPRDVFCAWVTSLVMCCVYPSESVEEYVADYNSYVTEATGLSGTATIREAVHDLLVDLNTKDACSVFSAVKDMAYGELEWSLAEAYLFVVEGLCSNEEAPIAGPDFTPVSFLNKISDLKNQNYPNSLVHARVMMLMPRFMEKFNSVMSVNSFGVSKFKDAIDDVFALRETEENELIKATVLVTATIWRNVPAYNLKLLGPETQRKLIEVACSLMDSSEEDTLPVLLEAISVAIDMDRNASLHTLIQNQYTVMEMVMFISFKDPSNVQLSIDSTECLQTLLEEIQPDQYLLICDKCVPYLLDVIKNNTVSGKSVEYSAALFLALELLGLVVGAAPPSPSNEDSLPQQLFLYAFPVLKDLILATSDDQILQNAGEVFNNFLQNGTKWFIDYRDPETKEKGLDILLRISSKFLSPELSDSAAMNCGLIVITLFEKFQTVLDQNFFYQLLQATVRRLVVAKEVITIENLVMVFCKLVLNTSPETVVDALTSMKLTTDRGPKDGLTLVMPIWFSSFEVTRGFEKIKQNILALGKIFSIGDPRVSELIVQGEPIPYTGEQIVTRSMTKGMPQNFTKIKAPLKILKLLVSELEFQCQQPDPDEYFVGVPTTATGASEANDGDDDGWEEMGDIGVPTFEKLQSYVDSDDDESNQIADEGIKVMVVQFFKECIAKNLGGFQSYYELLTDDEKTTISENVIFE